MTKSTNRGGKRINAGRKPDPNSIRSRRKARQQAAVLRPFDATAAPAKAATESKPLPVIDEADAPNDLTMDERRVWMEFAPLAMRNGRLTDATASAFKGYCRWVAIERACAMSVTDRGSATHDRAMKWVARFYAEFSLTPGGRAVEAPPQPAGQDEDDAFFGGPRGIVGGRG